MKRLRQAGRFGLRVVVPIVRVCWMVATSPLWLIAIFEHFGREVPWEDYHWFPFRYLWRKGVGQWTRTLRPLWDSCADVEVETMDDRSTLLRGEPAQEPKGLGDLIGSIDHFISTYPAHSRTGSSYHYYQGVRIPWEDPDPSRRVAEAIMGITRSDR